MLRSLVTATLDGGAMRGIVLANEDGPPQCVPLGPHPLLAARSFDIHDYMAHGYKGECTPQGTGCT